MNNDDQDDRDSLTEGDGDKQLGFETSEFASEDSLAEPRRPAFDAFDSDQATEYDDLETEDFGTEYIDDSSDYDNEDTSFTDEPDDDGPLDIWQQPADTPATAAGAGTVGTGISRTEIADDDDDVDLWGDTDADADDYDDTGDSPDWAATEETVPGWSNEPATQQDWQEEDEDPEEADWDNEDVETDLDPDDEPEDDLETSESWQTALDSDEWDGDGAEESSGFFESWPVGLIAVAVVALLLLAGGGYGVMQQRAEMQEEIRDLRAQLATAAQPQQVTDSRDAQRELSERNAQLQDQLDNLTLENRQLSDTVAGLENQLEGQRQAAIKLEEARAAARRQAATGSTSSAPAVTAAPKPASKPAATTAAASTGSWFVNFGSYSQQSVASDWATRLEASYGKVIVAPASANGKTVYRVRVVDLPSKAEADSVSGRLQQEYKLPTLWVGRQ
ncbi:MAG: SPOR domain-containing protein [Halieaceae bacterium]